MSQDTTLKEIGEKLDGIFAILKISNFENLNNFKKTISKDPVNASIIKLSDGTRNYSTLASEIAKELKVSEINVKKKISDLTKIGIIIAEKTPKGSFYKTTGVLD
ncbi:hypothetical protein [Nitrosopumilus sp.]|uniref:hypothetical protein n=1 Tax=Nitrosopumilus sp. TaxID=2024843 RepID=UPI003D0DC1E2